MARVLVVDDDLGVQESLRMLFKGECEVAVAGSADEGLRAIEEEPPDLVLLDLVMPGRSGLEVLRQMAARGGGPPVVVLTATHTVATAVEAMKLGAEDYVTKPFEVEALRLKVRRLLERRGLEEEVARLRSEVDRRSRLGGIVGRSRAMQEVFRDVERVARSRANVLITGESGTGKELVARAIHELGPRAQGPFVAVNCAAIPDSLIESELFGHEPGAFTDARERRIGKFEQAQGGTLLLDEVGELSPLVQAKLLRAIQGRTVERLGGTKPIPVDVRILAATNRDLRRDIDAGRFREDLYYRIHVVEIGLPPLRERRDDVRLLAQRFLDRFREAEGRGPRRLGAGALSALERYGWPGNVRELENVIERGVALADGDELQVEDLPDSVARAARIEELRDGVRSGSVGLEDATAVFERELLLDALVRAGWNQTRAAEQLGITRRVLKLKIDRYGLTPGTGVNGSPTLRPR